MTPGDVADWLLEFAPKIKKGSGLHSSLRCFSDRPDRELADRIRELKSLGDSLRDFPPVLSPWVALALHRSGAGKKQLDLPSLEIQRQEQRLIESSLHVTGDLGVDAESCLMVAGDLTVDGVLTVANPMSALLVGGNLKARLLSLVDVVIVHGDLEAEILRTIGNDGALVVGGKGRVRVIDNYDFSVWDTVQGELSLYKDREPDFAAGRALEKLMAPGLTGVSRPNPGDAPFHVPDYDRIWDVVAKGGPLFR